MKSQGKKWLHSISKPIFYMWTECGEILIYRIYGKYTLQFDNVSMGKIHNAFKKNLVEWWKKRNFWRGAVKRQTEWKQLSQGFKHCIKYFFRK